MLTRSRRRRETRDKVTNAMPYDPVPRSAAAGLESSARWPGWLLHLALLAAAATLAGLAALWLVRNPLLTSWDEIGHANETLSDALVLRQGNLAVLRDVIFLRDRWLPPGLRLVGLPIAAAFWGEAPTALRISAAVLTLLPAPVIYLGLRRTAGHAGAAAGALFFLLTPQNLVGAQSYMTETVLDLAAALAMALLLPEILASRPSLPRLLLLGPMLGLGALAKLTFLPTIGIVWAGAALYRWWRDRDAPAFWLRLVVPAVGLALVAWPHYILNSARYLAYARATAGGHAYNPVEATGLDFTAYVASDLVWEVFGLGGTALLLAAIGAAVLAWRALPGPQRAAVLLPVLAAAPPFLGFVFSRNQTERYLTISMVVLAYPIGLLLGHALRQVRVAAAARAMAGGAAAMALVQVALCWLVALGGPVEARPLRPIVEAAWRPNYPCDFTPMTHLLPRGPEVPRLGLFGGTIAVNPGTVLQPFLRAGIPARVIELVNNSETEVDWPRVMQEARQLDLILFPAVFWDREVWQGGSNPTEPAELRSAAARSSGAFRARLEDAELVEDRGVVSNGPHELCAIRVLAVRSPQIAPEVALRLKPLRPEVHVGSAP